MKLAKIINRSSLLNHHPDLKEIASEISQKIEEMGINSLKDFLSTSEFSELKIDQKLLLWKAYQQANNIYQWQQEVQDQRSALNQDIPAVILNELDDENDLAFIDFASAQLPSSGLSEHQRRDAIRQALTLFREVANEVYQNTSIVLQKKHFDSLELLSFEDAQDLNVLDLPISEIQLDFKWDLEALADMILDCGPEINVIKKNRIHTQLIEELILPQLPNVLWTRKMSEFQEFQDDELSSVEDSLAWINQYKSKKDDKILAVWPTYRQGSLYSTLVNYDGRIAFSNELTWDMNDPYSILESDLRHIKINHIVYPLNEEDESLNQLIEVLNSEAFADKINYQLIGISTENLEIGEPTSQDETAEVEAAAYALAKRMIALLKAWGTPADSEDYLDSTTLVSYLFTSAEIEDLNDRLFAKIEELRAKAGLDASDDDKKQNRPFRHQKIAEQIPARQIEELKPGMELDGIVSHTKNYGVFVDIGLEQPSLVHQSELATPGTRPNRYMIGYKVRVKVLSIDMDNKRAHLSMRNVQDPNINMPQQSYQPRRTPNGGNGYRPNVRFGQNQYQGGYQNNHFNNHYSGGNREGGHYQNHYRNDQYRNDGMNRQEGGYQGNGFQGNRSEYQNTPRNDYQGNNYQGGNREGGHREGGNREGGYREGGHREGGNREGGNREGGNREGGFRHQSGYQNNTNRQDQPYQKNFQGGNRQDQSFNDGNFRSQNNYRNNHNNGGYQNRDRQQNSYYGEGQNQQDFRPSYQRTPRNQYQQSSTSGSSTPDLDSMFEKKKKD